MVIFASSLPYSLSESNTPVMSHSIAPLQIFGGRQEAVTVFVSVFNQQKACQYQYFGPTQKILLLLHLRWGVVGGANAIRKRDRTALIWNQAILTRDNTNHYDDDKNRVVWFLEENRNQYEERWKSTPCKERRSDRVVKVCPTWWPTMGHCLEESVSAKNLHDNPETGHLNTQIKSPSVSSQIKQTRNQNMGNLPACAIYVGVCIPHNIEFMPVPWNPAPHRWICLSMLCLQRFDGALDGAA